ARDTELMARALASMGVGVAWQRGATEAEDVLDISPAPSFRGGEIHSSQCAGARRSTRNRRRRDNNVIAFFSGGNPHAAQLCGDRGQAVGFMPAPHNPIIRSYEDHRMATFGAILGLRIPGLRVENIATTGKTMPRFAHMWTDLVGR
ncbi:hypothetical protein R6H00_09705, partial [Actinotignum timonense]|nr:hypothetical protein [Actinotignum timonense]